MTEQGTLEELDGTWRILERPASASLRCARTGLWLAARQIQVALDRHGARYLLLPHPTGPDDGNLWRNRSMQLARATLRGEDGDTDTWLILRCKRAELEDAFARLCTVIVRRVTDHPDGPLGGQCVDILREWQDLLGGSSSGEDSITGLIGELLLLRRLATIDTRAAWEAWEGIRGGRHDFRRALRAVEAKTTTRQVGRVVRVNGLMQMESPVGGTLHLRFTRLERVPSGGLTIRSLADELVSLGIARGDLADVIEDLGHDMAAASPAFELRETRTYVVDDRFPRIVPSSFAIGAGPFGVTELQYSADLDLATVVDESAAEEALTALLRD